MLQSAHSLVQETNNIGQKYIALIKGKGSTDANAPSVRISSQVINEYFTAAVADLKQLYGGSKSDTVNHRSKIVNSAHREISTHKSACLNQIIEIHKELRRLPVISLSVPTVLLIGAPNVGKSSIVRHISSGLPEVNNYPFTTRGISVGHISTKSSITAENDHIQVLLYCTL